jgi:hypothetical protein
MHKRHKPRVNSTQNPVLAPILENNLKYMLYNKIMTLSYDKILITKVKLNTKCGVESPKEIHKRPPLTKDNRPCPSTMLHNKTSLRCIFEFVVLI